MLMHTDGSNKPPLQLKLDTLMSLMPELDPSKIDVDSVNALLADAFVAEGLQADGTPPPSLIQVIKMPKLNGHNSFTLTVAPQLFAPGELDPLTATVLLSQLQIKIDENAIKTGMLNIDADREAFERSQKKSEESMREADAAEDRAAAAAQEAKGGKIASAVMAVIGAIIGAVIASIFGGALLGGLALMGAFMALQEVVSVGIQSSDNPALKYKNAQGGDEHYGATFQDFISMGSAQRVKDGNLVIASQNTKGEWVNQQGKIIQDPRLTNPNAVIMSPKAFNDMSVGTAIGLTVFMTVMMLAGGIYAIRNPTDIVKVAERLTKLGVKVGDVGVTVSKAESIGTMVTGVSTAGGAAGDMTAAVLKKKTADEQLNLANANALKTFIQSMLDAQAKQMQMTQDFIHNLVELLQESLTVVAKSIGATYQLQVQIAQNLLTPRS
jgi:hypothetical protein